MSDASFDLRLDQSQSPRTVEAEERLHVLFEYAPDAIVVLDVVSGRFLDANPAAEKLFGLPRQSLLEVGPFDLSPPLQPTGASSELGQEKIAEAINGGRSVFDWWHCNAQGEHFPCEVHLVRIPWYTRVAIRGSIVETSHKTLLQLSEVGRRKVNDQIARGASVPAALECLVLEIERLLPAIRCSVLLLDRTANCLRHSSAPSLPDFYNAAVDGIAIGPTVGSCGAAAFHGRRVIVNDVTSHPNWAAFRELTERAHVKACWSEPIFSLAGEVLGTFAMYYSEVVKPSPFELRAIEAAAQIAATTIELIHAQQALHEMNATLEFRVAEEIQHLMEAQRQLESHAADARLSAVAFETHDSILITNKDGKILRVNESFSKLTGYTAEEIIGKTPSVLRSDRHDEKFYREMWSAISAAGFWSGELWNKRKDGHVYLQRLTITAVRNESGEITHYVGDGQDLTQERHAEAIRAELLAASVIQKCLLPSEVPCLPGVDIYGSVHPAGQVSGDFFNFVPIDENSVLIVVADVSGHGLGPGLLMAQMQSFLCSMPDVCFDPCEILNRANRYFCRSDSGRFVTMFLGCLDVAARSFSYAGAGHQGYLLKANRDVRTLRATSMPLGIEKSWSRCDQQVAFLEAGDIILIPTDGIEEAIGPSGEFFGRNRMFDFVRDNAAKPAREIVETLCSAVGEFSDEATLKDDVTAVIVKVLNLPPPTDERPPPTRVRSAP